MSNSPAVIELARAAANLEADGAEFVGAHLSVEDDDERLHTHLFESSLPGYGQWRWAVTVAQLEDGEPTICDVVLIPGPDALLAPEWIPWEKRVLPGDLGVGDVLPTRADDPRLVPGYAGLPADDELDLVALWEFGLGRARVLSAEGRDAVARRWYESDRGPRAPISEAAPARCASCAFFLPIAGSLRSAFGVCGNEYAPDDARVVSVDHGCGAHSQALVLD
ncbi:MAG: DUF3027 domain-containing protein [Actinobacteria bacterium]|uniref:Unannotated protein n=1 Tax=freshwater metagenome TaxID=449393 RepID=A0A6J6X1L3_9ZZZZ|nr:DUF3027 domain-containing protein [Actinomycetota bacterium]